jgi:hypothetical protein
MKVAVCGEVVLPRKALFACAGFFLVFGMLWAESASGKEKDAKYFEGEFNRLSKVIADLKKADTWEVATSEIELIRTWIGQAQAFLANDKLDPIESIVNRIEAQAEYIQARVDRTAAEKAAQQAEEQALAAEKQAQQATAATQAAEARIKELEAKGL